MSSRMHHTTVSMGGTRKRPPEKWSSRRRRGPRTSPLSAGMQQEIATLMRQILGKKRSAFPQVRLPVKKG